MRARRISFRTRLLVLVTATVLGTVALVTWAASESATRSFEALDAQRTAALVKQFRAEFARRGEEVQRRTEGIAASETVLQIAIEANRPSPDYAPFYDRASSLAESHGLPLVEIVDGKGVIVSSAQWPARFGYQEEWLTSKPDWQSEKSFLKREELPSKNILALVSVRTVDAGDVPLYVVAGLALEDEFVESLVLPEGMRAILVPTLDSSQLVDTAPGEEEIASLIYDVRASGKEATRVVNTAAGHERVTAIPLIGRQETLLGVLAVGSSRRELEALLARLRWEGVFVGAVGFVLGLGMTFWIARRVTKPLETVASGARAVAAGNWAARVDVRSGDEVEQLAEDFNRMTAQLLEQRDRLVQTERVAAWRELARRLAHELKNPLFPLQITVENLKRARAHAPEQFDEVFEESTSTLLSELANLKTIIGRFSDFARMPPPEMQVVDINGLVKESIQLFEAQWKSNPEASISPELDLDPDAGEWKADPEQLRRALRNLILNGIDAMPEGGKIRIRTQRMPETLVIEVSDTGKGLTAEEAERLFTPYYTTRRHGTGLGLAIVQSVVADHKGRISVVSTPGSGATFRMEFPLDAGKPLEPEKEAR